MDYQAIDIDKLKGVLMHEYSTTEQKEIFSKDGKFALGKEGWIFLANDTNDSFAQHTGKLFLSAGQINKWITLLENRDAWLDARGIKTAYIIAPDKHSIYPEYLPDTVSSQLAKYRTVHQILHKLDDISPNLRKKVIYPMGALNHAKQVMATHSKTDHHWNMWGSFIAYREICNILGFNSLIRDADFELYDSLETGSLGVKMEPQRKSVILRARLHHPRSKMISDNKVINHGRIIKYQHIDKSLPKGLIIGTSSAEYLLPYFAEHFSAMTHIHTPVIEYDYIREFKPDYVIFVLAETYLIKTPDDQNSKPYTYHAEEKIKEDNVYE